MCRHAPLLALVVAMLLGAQSADAEDWPTFMHDNHRSGVTGERLEPPLSESWMFKAVRPPEPAWPPPAKQDYYHHHHDLRETVAYDRAFGVVGAGQTIFFGSSADDKVYALDAKTGRTRWTFFTEGPVRLAPSVADGKVYVGSDDGCAYCLSARDGTLLWKYRAAEPDRMIPGNQRMISMWPLRTGPLVDEGTVYFGAGLFPQQGTFLCALDAGDGAVTWKQQIEISPQGYALASEERLYIPTGRANPAVFSRKEGRAMGELPSAGGTFALLTEDVLVAGPGRGAKELNAADVETKSKIAMFGGLRILVNGPTAYMQSETQLSAFDRGSYLRLSREQFGLAQQRDKLRDRLRKMDKSSAEAREIQQQADTLARRMSALGEKMKDCYLWTSRCEYPYAMIMAGDVLFVGGDNEIAAIEAGSGKILWTASVDGRAYGLSALNGALFASTDKGRIHCFRRDAQDGTQTITAETQENPYPNDSLTKYYAQAAELIVNQTGITKGYCLALGRNPGRLAHELARGSDLKIIGVEEDAERAADARQAIDKAGLYGKVVIHHRNSEILPYTKCFANLIVLDTDKLPPSAAEIFRMLRPYGGVVAVVQPAGSFERERLKKWGRPSLIDWKTDNAGEFVMARTVRAAPEGAGEWTHNYAEPGNTASSGDRLVKGDMTIQWFGEPGPRDMIDRHHRNVPPLFKAGRLFVPGDCVVFAVDAYNGTIEWKIEVPNSRRLGAFLDAGSMAVDDKFLYVVAEDKCYGFNVRTGRCGVTYLMPQLIESESRHWGYIAYSGDVLFASAIRPGASYSQTSYEADEALWYRDMKVVVSDYLFALEKASGRRLWTYQGGLVLNTTLAVQPANSDTNNAGLTGGGGRMYFIETTSPKALADTLGRMPVKTLFHGGDQYLVALDMQTGQTLFKTKIDVTDFEEPVYLNYAKEMLLLSGSRLIERSVRYYYRAFDAGSGRVRWDTAHDTGLAIDGGHGEYNRHPTIIEDTVYAWPCAYNLKTGAKIDEWKFDRHGHGCGGVTASAQCLFWRGGNPWMYELGPGGGPQRLNMVTRPGCWINIIPAGGLVLVPESSSGCTCGFPLQTSMALIPK